MEVFRISKKEYSAPDGIGGLYYPGRWHEAGHRVVYTSQFRSLAALEYLVHLSSSSFLQLGFVMTTIFIPDDVPSDHISYEMLGTKWTDQNNIIVTRKLGTNFLEKGEKLILKVPTAIVPEEYNFIINPVHPDFKLCKVIFNKPFTFDFRLVK
jgi:RES domain-containing protein